MKLPKRPRGAGSAWFEDALAWMASCRLLPTHQFSVSVTSQGQFYRSLGQDAGAGATLGQLRLKAHGDDWMRCRSWNGTAEGTEDIYVARDPELRRTRFDGKTIAFDSDGDTFSAAYAYTSPTKRTKTVGGVAEPQAISPYYVIDASTSATSTSSLISCLRTSDPTGVNDPAGNPISLVEVTQRAWAKLEAVVN